jgi:hypothetical protein
VTRLAGDAGFQMLLRAGLAPDAAIDVLDDETKRADGELDLWCNGNQLPRHYIRQCLRFSHNGKSMEINPVGVGWEKPPDSYVFEFDAGQVQVLIEKRQQALARERDKAAGGRHPHPDRTAILKNYRQRRARRERNAAKNTAQWVEKEVAEGRLTEIVHPDTIRTWDREEKPGPRRKNRMK